MQISHGDRSVKETKWFRKVKVNPGGHGDLQEKLTATGYIVVKWVESQFVDYLWTGALSE
jgi:hypothetical protein